MKQDMIIILDLGSTENTVVARQIRDMGVYSEIHPHDITVEELRGLNNVKGIILNGGEKVITAILPIMDDMERALEQMRKTEDVQAIVEGVELIQKKFMGILEKQGVKPIETKEADFDVEIHEAVAQFPAPTPEMKNKVVDCTLKGYKLNEKVIRHAQVVVGI